MGGAVAGADASPLESVVSVVRGRRHMDGVPRYNFSAGFNESVPRFIGHDLQNITGCWNRKIPRRHRDLEASELVGQSTRKVILRWHKIVAGTFSDGPVAPGYGAMPN